MYIHPSRAAKPQCCHTFGHTGGVGVAGTFPHFRQKACSLFSFASCGCGRFFSARPPKSMLSFFFCLVWVSPVLFRVSENRLFLDLSSDSHFGPGPGSGISGPASKNNIFNKNLFNKSTFRAWTWIWHLGPNSKNHNFQLKSF